MIKSVFELVFGFVPIGMSNMKREIPNGSKGSRVHQKKLYLLIYRYQ